MTLPQAFGRDAITALLPHAGHMCLLDRVLHWDAESISCRTRSHRSAENPLRGARGLAAVNAIEYAAQAMAIHAGLQAKSPTTSGSTRADSAHGVIASVRSVRLGCARLDTIDDELEVAARLISGDPLTAMYEFWICAGDVRLVDGRASVLFDVSVR